jgi:CRISPR-associated protein Cmr1
MRKPKIQPSENLIPDQPPHRESEIRQERSYRLITPLFGGGVEPGVADPVTVIRGTAIRGHLRFWWRACRGGSTDTNGAALSDEALRADMKQRESEIWGAASLLDTPGASQVQIEVSIQNHGEAVQAYIVGSKNGRKKIEPHDDVPAYAAFPLQPEYRTARPGMDTKKVVFDIEFTVTLTYPETFKQDIAAALWAWETFGGIGGRARRGFGALQLISLNGQSIVPPKPEHVAKMIADGLKRHVIMSDRWPRDVPHLKQVMSQIKVIPRPTGKQRWDELDAWFDLINALGDFRQKRYDSTKSNRHPGRSMWPEPDAIRHYVGTASDDHKNPRSTLYKFPRAVFGLPIVFHFKDDEEGDPKDTILQGEKVERLASPLILRPLACAGHEAVGIAIVLGTPQLPTSALVLKDAKTGSIHQKLGQADVLLDAKDARTIAPLNRQPDVLQAFLDSL